ncbi:MAG: phage holin family protein [Bacilli bacterium]
MIKLAVLSYKKTTKKIKINVFLDWLMRMAVYAAIILVMSVLFKNTIIIDHSMYGLWGLLLAIIIYCLNKIIKPLIVFITLPLTGVTMGLFYPFISVIILKIADLILGSHFNTGGILMTCFVALLIGFFNMLMDKIIINTIFEKGASK